MNGVGGGNEGESRGGRELGKLEDLRRMLVGHTPKRGEVDKVSWWFDPQGGYTIKTLRKVLEETSTKTGGGIWGTDYLDKINPK